jgi:hypothetical protein
VSEWDPLSREELITVRADVGGQALAPIDPGYHFLSSHLNGYDIKWWLTFTAASLIID